MRTTYKIKTWILGILAMVVLTYSCAKADEEFVHRTNTISQMICKASHGGGEFQGAIYEYNANDELMTGSFNQEDIDLTNIYLTATLTYDEIITPSLSGRHDITGDGIIITVKSGVGTTRRYRVRGYYE